MPKKPKPIVLPPIRPSEGFAALYQKRLVAMIDEMAASCLYWTRAAYRQNEPAIMAMDDIPADMLKKTIAELTKRWLRRFDKAADELAEYFALGVSKRTDQQFRAILKRSGLSVDFVMTKAQRDIAKATVQANVSLIKSIPQQYLGKVEGAVMRSVQTGRDVGGLVKELQAAHGVTRKRASLIARDQNNKATSSFNRARQQELGITQARWKHSFAGKEPRPSHLKAGRDGVVYNIAEGWYDPDEGRNIQPGELINCRCTSQSIIPGFI